jgi:hypothetical protein
VIPTEALKSFLPRFDLPSSSQPVAGMVEAGQAGAPVHG